MKSRSIDSRLPREAFTQMRRWTLCVLLAVSTSDGLLVGADQPDYWSPERLSAKRRSLREGQEIAVLGKYKELVDTRLHLYDCDVSFLVEDDMIFRQLLGLRAKRDNILLRGVVKSVDGETVVEVQKLEKAPTDLELLAAQLDQLEADNASDKGDAVFELALKMQRAGSDQNEPELLTLARRAFTQSLTAEVSADALEARLRRVRKMHDLVRDDAFTRDILVALMNDRSTAAVTAALQAIECREYLGEWVTYSEFKRKEGLFEHDGRWVSRHERHLLETIASIPKDSLLNVQLVRRRTQKEYILMAEKGKTEVGMGREEVCLALGFPTYVLRRAHLGKEFDQWRYPSLYCYFFDGTLIHVASSKK